MTAEICIALLLLAIAVAGTHAVEFAVVAVSISDSERRFEKDVGRYYAVQTLNLSSQFVWNTFAQQSPTDRKNLTVIVLQVLEKNNGITYMEGNEIYLSSDYVVSYSGDLKKEVTGIVYQEVAAIWQWDANGAAPKWWHGAIHSYVRLIAGFPYSNFALPGDGDTWEHGVDITARFIQYLDTVTPGFVAKLNAKIRTSSIR